MSSTYWWTVSRKEAHEKLHAHVELLKDRFDRWNERIRQSLDLYRDTPVSENWLTRKASSLFGEEVVHSNVIQSCVDTLHARIASKKPRPKFLTNNGNWEERIRAKQRDKFVEGVYHQNQAYDKAADSFWDALVAGVGFLKVYAAYGKIYIERIYPGEILVDDKLSHSQKPRTKYHVKRVPAEILLDQYPDKKDRDAIKESVDYDSNKQYVDQKVITQDMVEVREGWHLPPSPDTPGKHIISVSKGTLLFEDYRRDRYPIVEFYYSSDPNGFYKQSLVEQMRSNQLELNRLDERIQEAVDYMATSWIVIEDGSVDEDQITNQVGSILKYRQGSPPPNVIPPPSLNNQVFMYRDGKRSEMYETTGISQLSASNVLPPQIESGKAIRTLSEKELGRWAQLSRTYERNVAEDLAYVVMDVAADAYDNGMSVKSRYVADKYVETIDWDDIKTDDEYVVKAYPVNFLSETPSGKIADLEQLIGMGLIQDPKIAAMYLDFPDIQNLNDIESASIDSIDRVIDKALYDNEYIPPRPYYALDIAVPRVSAALQRAESEGCPEDRLEKLRLWLAEAAELLKPPSPPQQVQPPTQLGPEAMGPSSPGMMPPGMVPGAPPGIPPGMPIPGMPS